MDNSVDTHTINQPLEHASSNDTVLPAGEHSGFRRATLSTDYGQFFEILNKAQDVIIKNLTELDLNETTMAMQKEYAELPSMLSPNFILLANKLALELYGDRAPSFFLE